MSFILDALKKSENERQQQQSADFASVPSGRDSRPAPRWLWALGLLLVVNLAVVAGLLLRPETLSSAPAIVAPPATESPQAEDLGDSVAPGAARPTFSERVADARRNSPAPVTGPQTATDVTEDTSAEVTPAADAPSPAPEPARTGVAELPSLEELQIQGRFDLPPLHLDLHVYNETPAQRFVSINMNKYRENETLREGPRVREITPEGVILEYQDTAFALLQ